MRFSSDGPADHQWGRFGFLFADLFTLLAVLFLVANTVGHVPPLPPPTPGVTVTPGLTPSPTPSPTPPPLICGLAKYPTYVPSNGAVEAAGDGSALRQKTPDAVRAFANQVKALLAHYNSKTAGFVIVWAGSYNGNLDVGDGTSLAEGAIAGLTALANGGFVFSRDKTSYQPLWNGNLQSNQVLLEIFFYNIAETKTC